MRAMIENEVCVIYAHMRGGGRGRYWDRFDVGWGSPGNPRGRRGWMRGDETNVPGMLGEQLQ